MNIKNRLDSFIRGWFPKEPKLPRNKLKIAETQAKVSKTKPWWWKPYWIISVILTLAVGLALPFFTHVTVDRTIIGLALSFLGLGIAYYIRVRPSIRVNRALYILLGITPIGFVIWIIWAISGIGRWVTQTAGPGPSLLISWIVCYGIGALIGDWIGKKRNYILPMTP